MPWRKTGSVMGDGLSHQQPFHSRNQTGHTAGVALQAVQKLTSVLSTRRIQGY